MNNTQAMQEIQLSQNDMTISNCTCNKKIYFLKHTKKISSNPKKKRITETLMCFHLPSVKRVS